MTTATLERVTTAEFLARADQDDFELIDGKLKERCMGMESAWVATQFATRLTMFNMEHRLGPSSGTTRRSKSSVSVTRYRSRMGSSYPPNGIRRARPSSAV